MTDYIADETQYLIDLYESDSKRGIKENRLESSTPPNLSARLDEFTNEAYDDLIDIAKYINKEINILKKIHARAPLDRIDSKTLRMLQNVEHQIDLALERKDTHDDDCTYFCETNDHRYSYFADAYPCHCELPNEITDELSGGNKKRKTNRRKRKQSSKSRKTRKNIRKNARNARRKQKAGSKKRVKYNKTRKTNKTKKNQKLRK